METEEQFVFVEARGAARQTEMLQEVGKALSNLQLSEELQPESYRINSPKEDRLVEIADNFQRQYLLLHPDRKPLLLCPVNECGVRKFVSTTVQPTTSDLGNLYYWQECSSFVADFLSLQPLEPPTVVPSQLFSPTSVLHSQNATCFESSTLLCSILLALNYQAYCVSGYASREICLLDQSLQQCRLLDTELKGVQRETSEQKQQQKYGVRSLRKLMEEERKKREVQTMLQEKELQEEKSPRLPDPLEGFRVHCWVLILSGKRGIKKNFFIDPLTGNSFPTNDENFQGIESVWDNFNCFVNRQECIHGCRDILFDLENSSLWEKVFEDAISKQLLDRLAQRRKEERLKGITGEAEKEMMKKIMPGNMLLLNSWVSHINISKKDIEKRFPWGGKVTFYRKAKLERSSPTANKDGLVCRLTKYKDLECTEVTEVKEWYKHRSDGLEEREFNKLENVTTERFKPKAAMSLLFHRWKPVSSGTEREMRYNLSQVLPEHLQLRVVSPKALEETFVGRSDFLYFRHVTFSLGNRPSTASPLTIGLENLCVQKVVESFHRNVSKPANEDVAQRVFLVPEQQTLLIYHLMDHRFIPSIRRLRKPEKAQLVTDDLFSTFQIDQSQKPSGTLWWYNLLMDQKKGEENVAIQINASLREAQAKSEGHMEKNPSAQCRE